MAIEPHSISEASAQPIPASLSALLGSIVDYAGLFPPARLPIEESLDNYIRYRTEPEVWMLARFVIKVGSLDELAMFRQVIVSTDPISLSVLGSGGEDISAFVRNMERDLNALAQCHDQFGGQVHGDVMEVPIPASLFKEPEQAHALVDEVAATLASGPVSDLMLFLEIPFRSGFQYVFSAVLQAVGAYGKRAPDGHVFPIGLKMRTGGADASAVPEAGNVARVIAGCRDANVPFKATAGLHHPMRHYDSSLETETYGFFNVFGGATLAAAHALDEDTIASMLLETDVSRLRFEEDRLAWGDYSVETAEIRRAREKLAISFGSCSFDEPREDLKALGLI